MDRLPGGDYWPAKPGRWWSHWSAGPRRKAGLVLAGAIVGLELWDSYATSKLVVLIHIASDYQLPGCKASHIHSQQRLRNTLTGVRDNVHSKG